MKYILSFFHSIYFSYVCWLGGKIEGGEYYILWTIHINGKKDVTMKDLKIDRAIWVKYLFYIHNSCDLQTDIDIIVDYDK